MEDLHMGEIYKIKNTLNGKLYIGKANKYVSKNNQKWGTQGRWKSHVNEAMNKGGPDHCRLLNAAIRKYGADNFEVTKVCDCTLEEIGEKEQKYIKEFGSMVPDGYNLTEGGDKGKDSAITRQRKSESRKKVVVTEEAKKNQGLGQLGNRRAVKARKYPEDADLPKYICAIRKDGKIMSYDICKYPIGVDEKDYISKTFKCTTEPQEKALEEAKKYLDELKEKYEAKVQKEIAERKKKEQEAKATAVVEEQNPVIDEYIYTIIDKTKIAGYRVAGLKDKDGNPIPDKVFNKNQNNHNLEQAKKYLQQVLTFVEKGIEIEDWSKVDTVCKRDKQGIDEEHLPKYINIAKNAGVKAGYVVNGYPLPDDKKSCKKFTNSKFTMEERYKLALEYLDDIKIKFPMDESKKTN